MKKEIIYNIETNSIELVEMTEADLKQNVIDQSENEARLAEAESKATAKAELLDRLGITAEEAQLLLS